jgi:hypothetical protein
VQTFFVSSRELEHTGSTSVSMCSFFSAFEDQTLKAEANQFFCVQDLIHEFQESAARLENSSHTGCLD